MPVFLFYMLVFELSSPNVIYNKKLSQIPCTTIPANDAISYSLLENPRDWIKIVATSFTSNSDILHFVISQSLSQKERNKLRPYGSLDANIRGVQERPRYFYKYMQIVMLSNIGKVHFRFPKEHFYILLFPTAELEIYTKRLISQYRPAVILGPQFDTHLFSERFIRT